MQAMTFMAPPQPLHRDNRLTVMEKIFAPFLRTRRRD